MAREFKDSGIEWIGQIPKEWKYARYKFSGCFVKGKLPVNQNNEKVGLPIIGASEMLGKECRTFTADTNVPTCSSNDILILWDGANAGIIANKCEGVVSSTAVKYTCTDGRFNRQYLFYLLKNAEPFFKSKVNGTTIPHMNSKYIDDYVCLLPSLSEQQKIADYLDKVCCEVDEMVVLQETMIEELKAYKQSVITEAVTKGLDPNVPMRNSGIDWIGEIPEHWEVCRFKDIASVKANLVHPDDYMDYPQIAPDNIEKASGRLLPYKSVKESNVISDNHLFFKGQIIYSKIRPVLNKLIIAPFDGLCSADMYPIETTNDINYQKYYMLSDAFVRQVALVVQDRVKMPKINQNELSVIYVLSLPFTEQSAIASYLDNKCSEIDSLIALKQAKIDELKEYKKSVIYEYVTGKKEVV